MTIQYVLATGFSLILLVLIANLLVDLYARAAVRDALDEAARAAVPVGASAAACRDRADAVVAGLLHGSVGRDVAVRCTVTATEVAADADVRLASWLPVFVPDWRFSLHAVAQRDG